MSISSLASSASTDCARMPNSFARSSAFAGLRFAIARTLEIAEQRRQRKISAGVVLGTDQSNAPGLSHLLQHGLGVFGLERLGTFAGGGEGDRLCRSRRP